MKTSGELEKLDRIATDAENDFWREAENTATSLITAKWDESETEENLYHVDVDRLFGDRCRVLKTTEIENDGMSGSAGSEHEWMVEEIWVVDGVLRIQCEGYEFDLEDFERHDVIHLIKLLEDFDPDAEATEDKSR